MPRVALLLLALWSKLGASDRELTAAVRLADDERVAATIAADPSRLASIYSDDLHYAHSSGRVDTKTSQIARLISSPYRTERIEYIERVFRPIAPGVVIMTGRARFHEVPRAGGETLINDLIFLAIWREENGMWRFRAWQSCKVSSTLRQSGPEPRTSAR